MPAQEATGSRQAVVDATTLRRSSTILHLAPFLALSRELSALLVPIRPDAGYRDRLEEGLLVAARLQHARSILDIHVPEIAVPAAAPVRAYERVAEHLVSSTGGVDRRWVIGATALGSALSIAGLVAYWWRHRSQQAA
jgi:hypothetical protein